MNSKLESMKFVYGLAGLVFLSACGVFQKDKNQEITQGEYWEEEPEFLEEDAPMIDENLTRPRYQATETVFTDLIHTKLEVSFDWTKSWMYGKATITAKPHFYASDSLFLDAKGMEIKSVLLNQQALKYRYDGENLRIQLDKKYTRNEKYTIEISYIAKPDERETSGSAAITSDKGLYFINPKGENKNQMPQIWTQGETEASSVWFPTIDAPNVKTTQEIFITVDAKYATLSNGKLIKSNKNADGTRTDHWKQDLPHVPYLFMMGIGEFKVVKDSYTRPDGSKMEVNYYVEPEWEQHARAIFGETPRMIAYFSDLLKVPYPWDKYHQIVVREYVSGAMENTGAVIFGDYAYKTDRELLDENDQSTIAHELFHHWFGDLVTCESWSNLPLNESFANYSQYLWDEHRFGLDEADYQAEQQMYGYMQNAANAGHHNLIWFDYDDKEQMFDGHSYNKGGRILHMLRNYVGDEAFFLALSKYLKDNQFKAAEIHHLRLVFEEITGEDLNWFFNQWFFDDGHPELQIDEYFSAANGEVVLTITQLQSTFDHPIFRLPVDIAVVDDAGKKVHRVVLDKVVNKVVLPVKGKLKTVIFDESQTLLAEVTFDKPALEYVNQYYASERFAGRRDAVLYGSSDDSPESQKLILDALKDPFWSIRQEAISKAVFLKGDNVQKGYEIIEKMVKTDSVSSVREAAIEYLVEAAEPAAMEKILLDRLENDLSYRVIGTALARLGILNPELGMKKAKSLENDPSSKLKSGIAQLYAVKGTKDNFSFFDQLMRESKLQGYDAIYGLNSFTIFMTRQDVDLQEKATELYRVQKEKGGFYVNMFLGQNVDYLIKTIENNQVKSQAELQTYEKNNQPLYADQTRKIIAQQTKVLTDLRALMVEIGE